MEMSLREQRVIVITKILGEIEFQRNKETVFKLARAWDIDSSEVKSSHRFKKELLFRYKTTLHTKPNSKSCDEIMVTFEMGVIPEINYPLSFSFYVYNEEVDVIVHLDHETPETLEEKINAFIQNFLIHGMGIAQ